MIYDTIDLLKVKHEAYCSVANRIKDASPGWIKSSVADSGVQIACSEKGVKSLHATPENDFIAWSSAYFTRYETKVPAGGNDGCPASLHNTTKLPKKIIEV